MDYYNKELNVHTHVEKMGSDLCITICGGDSPHIGSIAIADPRESLTGNGSPSATVSTFNFTGHKDDEVANEIAHAVSARLSCRVVVACGLHYNEVDEQLFRDVKALTAEIIQRIC